ncbi:MAG: MBL fold metallo-hydrolase, partial [Vicinamibacteria bacterium]
MILTADGRPPRTAKAAWLHRAAAAGLPVPEGVVIADGADLLLSEATLRSTDEDAQPPERRGHLTPAEAGEAARDGRVSRLVLTHLPV